MTVESRNSWLVLTGLFTLIVLTCMYRIDFPLFWHPNEFGKYLQLHTGQYDFRHPQLMLRLTSAIDAALSITSVKSVIISGRIVSAISVGVACCSFALFVRNRFGLIFGIAAGILVALSPTVFVSSHFFKEDAVLLASIALSMLAMQCYEKEQSTWNCILIGATVGAACSSKYVGVIMIIPAAFVLIRSRSSVLNFVTVAVSMLALFCAVNYPAFLADGSLYKGLKFETVHVATEHNGLRWGPASPRTLIHYWMNVSAIMLGLFLAGAFASVKKLSLMDGVVLVLPFLWLFTVQLSAVSFVHYAMPAIALTVVGSVWFTARICEEIGGRRAKISAFFTLGLAGILSLMPTSRVLSELHNNARDRTYAWIKKNVSPDAVIATEFFVGLPTEQRLRNDPSTVPLSQKIIEPTWTLERNNTPEALRQEGFTHVVVSSSSFKRYFDPYVTLSPSRGALDKNFYVSLFAQHKPIHVERGYLVSDEIISSDILVFDIQKADSTATPSPTPID